ncbi:MFS transporter [Aeromicrobium sp. HA]|uniref:MFS transporter n=1 Tax=Aeromicrobium sp. HA TaxID=3009077 RepID=UPI0022AE5FDB|nr:MFS transporter [Aeromicrobium sp. HA]
MPAIVAGTALVLVTYVTPMATLPPTARDLTASGVAQAWILSSMSIGLAGGLLAAGVLGDRYGRRRVYLAGLVLLTAGAAASAAAWNPWILVGSRVLQGLGGAAILACGLAVLAHTFAPGPQRLRATAAWGASVGAGIAGGSVMAVALDFGTSWRENYVATAALGLLLLAPTARTVQESRSALPRRLDAAGMALLAAGMVLLVATLTQARTGWGTSSTLLVVLALTSFIGLAVIESRTLQPLVDPEMLRELRFLAAIVGALTVGLSIIAVTSFLPTVAQAGFGDSLRIASIPTLAWAVASTLAAVLLRRVPVNTEGPAAVSVLLAFTVAGMLLMLLADSTAGLVLPMTIAGISTGILNAVLGREAVASVPLDHAAMASGATNTARYLGAACGITLIVVIGMHGGADIVAGWHRAVIAAAAFGALGSLLTAVIAVRGQS